MPGNIVRASGFICSIKAYQQEHMWFFDAIERSHLALRRSIYPKLLLKVREEGSGHTVSGFNALTASLCSARRVDAVKRTQRMGTLNSLATLTQCARVSMSALVLSVMFMCPLVSLVCNMNTMVSLRDANEIRVCGEWEILP